MTDNSTQPEVGKSKYAYFLSVETRITRVSDDTYDLEFRDIHKSKDRNHMFHTLRIQVPTYTQLECFYEGAIREYRMENQVAGVWPYPESQA